MADSQKFLNWLDELKNPENNELMESVVKVFGELLEYNESGSAGINNSNDASYMDNQLNINPNSSGFQDNIMEEVKEDSLLEFAPPAIVTAASGAAISANPDENMISPMVSDMQPPASNQIAVTDSDNDEKSDGKLDETTALALKELQLELNDISEKIKKIISSLGKGREVIMEEDSSKK